MSFLNSVDEATQRKEKEKARELRQTAWWKGQKGMGRCFYCHGKTPADQLTMDHKVPIVRGGKSTKKNIVPACKDCNNEKKFLLLDEWIAQREAEGRPLACAGKALE